MPSVALLALVALQGVDHDLVYFKKGGAAFTMDAFRPARPNGIAVLSIVSGGWFSDHSGINAGLAKPFTDQGITVFEVVHGAQPRYKIPEIEEQIGRAVRYVRANAATYGVSPTKIGIFGGSAGGHLSLMSAVLGDAGNPGANDPVLRASSKPNAIVALFPPTDFANFGATGRMPFREPKFAIFSGAFPLKPDASPEEIGRLARTISPIYGVDASFPPTLLMHGDKDDLVPLEQSQRMDEALGKADVDHKLVVLPGEGHATAGFGKRIGDVVSWFLTKLK